MKSTSEYLFERNDNSRSAVQQKYFLQRNEPRGKLDKPHPSRSLNKDKKCDWKPLAPKIFAFVGMLLVFLVVNLICALPLFCFEKATRERERERERESSYLSKYLLSIRYPLSNTRPWLLPLISKGIRYLFSARQRRNLWVARFISL